MAKKKTARTARKTTMKAGKKPPGKAAKKPAKKPARKSFGPKPVKTGRGPGPAEIGAAVVAAINAGAPDHELWGRFWSPQVESIEGEGVAMVWRGRRAMEEKGRSWMEAHTVHGASAEGPYLGATGFAIKFRMDVEEKGTGKREVMEEVGVYTVENGKVVREEFMYGSKHPVPPMDARMEPAEETGVEAVLRV